MILVLHLFMYVHFNLGGTPVFNSSQVMQGTNLKAEWRQMN